MFPSFNSVSKFALDTETTGLQYKRDEVFGFSVSTEDEDWYWDIRENPIALEWLSDTLNSFRGSHILLFNAQFDYKMLLHMGIQIPAHLMDCAAIRAALIESDLLKYDMDSLCERYLGENKENNIYEELAEMFGGPATRKAQAPNMHRAPSWLISPYAKKDTRLTYDLWQWQEGEIERQGLQQICEFERSAMPTVCRTASRGVRVDEEQAIRTQPTITAEINRMEAELEQAIGYQINVNSPPQVKKMFNVKQEKDGEWYTDNGVQCGKTKKGGCSLSADTLKKLDDKGDIRAKYITDIRSSKKTRDTFLKKHILEHSIDGRVFPTINQVAGDDGGTKTGRFSYVDPALQQIPNRNKKVAEAVKTCFIPDEGQTWLDVDLNSFEVRVFAHLVAIYNKQLVEYYHSNPDADLHQYVADLMNIPRNPQAEGGANAKQINLSMIFNSGNGAIAEKVGLPWDWNEFTKAGKLIRYRKAGIEAMALIDKYHQKVGGVRTLADRCQRVAEQKGQIQTMYGRRLRFKNGYKAYSASGLLIQATSADVNKENWSLVEQALGDRGNLLLNTHDSYSMSVDTDKVQECYRDVKSIIERDALRVPLKLDLNGFGPTWWDAVKPKEKK